MFVFWAGQPIAAILLNSDANWVPSFNCDVPGRRVVFPLLDKPCKCCNVDMRSGFDTFPAAELIPEIRNIKWYYTNMNCCLERISQQVKHLNKKCCARIFEKKQKIKKIRVVGNKSISKEINEYEKKILLTYILIYTIYTYI